MFRNYMILLATCFVLFSAIQVESEEKIALNSLCSQNVGKGVTIELNSISQVRGLIEEIKREENRTSCSQYEGSLLDLEPILDAYKRGVACSLEVVDLIRKYHLAYIAGDIKENSSKIWLPLRHFFMALSFQISADCKSNLIISLEYDTKGVIEETDYQAIDLLSQSGATIIDNSGLTDFDDIIILEDVNSALAEENANQDDKGSEESKILIKIKTTKLLKDLIKTCHLKFKPFYDKLIMPLVKLSNLGYNYQGEFLERELKELRENPSILRWYNIVQICESFLSIEIFDDPEEQVGSQQAITFVSGEEAAVLRSRKVNKLLEENEKPVVYNPPPVEVGDRLSIKGQAELETLISKYKSSKSESDRIRDKLFKKALARMKDILMSGKIKMLASDIFHSIRGTQQEESTDLSEDLLHLVDDAVNKDEQTVDSPVSGIGPKNLVKAPVFIKKGYKYPAQMMTRTKIQDKSKMTDRLYRATIGRFALSKWGMLRWLVFLIGIMLILVCISMSG